MCFPIALAPKPARAGLRHRYSQNVIPAVGILDYMYTELELPFTEDK